MFDFNTKIYKPSIKKGQKNDEIVIHLYTRISFNKNSDIQNRSLHSFGN